MALPAQVRVMIYVRWLMDVTCLPSGRPARFSG
jgi:hypothetical protein